MSVGDFKDASMAVYKYLADGATKSLAVDGTTPVEYSYKATVPTLLNRALIYYKDGGTWTEVKFGSLAALTNGLKFEVHRNGTVILDLFDGVLVKNNGDMSRVCYDNEIRSVGSGEAYQPARYTFGKAGQPLLLRRNDSVVMTVQDDIQLITEMYVMVQGYKI